MEFNKWHKGDELPERKAGQRLAIEWEDGLLLLKLKEEEEENNEERDIVSRYLSD